MLRDDKLDFWVEHDLNVLLVGKHGVGKTSLVTSAFDRAGLKWKYFSASTMDPWVDFVGVPRAVESKQPDGSMLTHLELVRPKDFANGEIEALFFDEFNRSPKKVRNAVMELLQFKSINGVRFPNLKIVWAAINPDDEEGEYQVEALDPAQEDRFHIKISISYQPDKEWFAKEFGEKIADSAIEWWNGLSDELKNQVSPRRLEYALRVYKLRGDIRDVLPGNSNINKLSQALSQGPICDKLDNFLAEKNYKGAKLFLTNENNYAQAMKFIPQNQQFMDFFLPLLNKEKVSALLNSNEEKCIRFIITNMGRVTLFKDIGKELIDANTNQTLCRRIKKAMTEDPVLQAAFASESEISQVAPAHVGGTPSGTWEQEIVALSKRKMDVTSERMDVFKKIESSLPAEMSVKSAIETLKVLSKIVNSSFAQTITMAPMANLPGIVNNCFKQIANKENLEYNEIINRYGNQFTELTKGLTEANLNAKIWQGN